MIGSISEAEPTGDGPQSITILLRQIAAGSGDVDALYGRIEHQFRMMATRLLRGHQSNLAPEATEVIDEVFLKLIRRQDFTWENRRHFLRSAAVSMRRWIANYYRDLDAAKRRGDKDALPLSGGILADARAGSPAQIVELSDLCDAISERHPLAMEALNDWAFGGWTQEEIAEIMGLPLRRVESLIALAKRLIQKAVRDE